VKASHLPRYEQIARLLLKHGRRDRAWAGADDLSGDAASEEDAKELACELEAMGPTFVKLGQLLSTRADLLPPVYLKALSRLQDEVEPLPFDTVERVVVSELGVPLLEAFADFSPEPAAAASLGQVHRATLPDGRPVAVKVQRPDIRDRIVADMEVIEELADFMDAHTELGRRYDFSSMVVEFRRALFAELDYRQEARNLTAVGANLAGYEAIVVPRPVDELTTQAVLTMDWVGGRSVGALDRPVGAGGSRLAEQLLKAYLDQVLVDGLFHADPHPGNVLLTDDGRLGLIDLGMVARVAPETQDSLIKLLTAVSSGRGLDAAAVMIDLGQRRDGFDRQQFERDMMDLVSRNRDVAVADVQAGAVIGEIMQAAGEAGLRPPSELTMLGKALLNLDDVARRLDPQFNPNAVIEGHAGEIMRRKLLESASPANMLAAALEAKEFAEKLPSRVNKVMDALADGRMTLNIQGIDEKELMRGVQKLANRIAAALVVAALVVGAALMARINTTPKLLGYPAVAMVLFLAAAAAGAALLVSIVLSDLPQHRRWRDRH